MLLVFQTELVYLQLYKQNIVGGKHPNIPLQRYAYLPNTQKYFTNIFTKT